MIEADRVHSTPPLNSSPVHRPMFPPVADSIQTFPAQPATGQLQSQTPASDSPKPFEALDLAQLRFVRCLVSYGTTLDVAEAVIAAELDRARRAADKKRRRRFDLVGQHLVAAQV